MKNTLKIVLIVTVSFLLYYAGSRHFSAIMKYLNSLIHYGLLSYLMTYLLIGIPIFAGTMLVCRTGNVLKGLGLNKGLLPGLLLAILFTSPMWLGGWIFNGVKEELSIPNLIAGTIFAGFFEETYFRGFLFGLVFRKTKLGFIPAIILGAVVFAMGHLYQSEESAVQLGLFFVTFLGSGFFAWLFVEWNYNLWVAIFLHTLMNFSWLFFDLGANAVGGTVANILRVATIIIAIVATVVYKKRTGEKFEVNKHTLLMKKAEVTVSAG